MAYLSNKAGDGDITPLEKLLLSEIAALGFPLQYLRVDITGIGLEYATLPSGVNFLAATGTVNGINTSFSFVSEPSIIFVDQGRSMQKVSSDGTVNWTGTTNVNLTIPPNFDIYAL